MRIDDIDFGQLYNVRIKHVLRYNGIETVNDWRCLQSHRKNGLGNLGKKSIAVIEEKIANIPFPSKFWHSGYYGSITWQSGK